MTTQRLYNGTLIEAENVTRSFGKGKHKVDILRGVDFDVQAGELVALFGSSGSGKTTLLNLIGALDSPTSGEIKIQGENLNKMAESKKERLRRQKFGFIFQTYTLMPTYTASENIDLVLRLPSLNIFERQRRIKSALEAVGLTAWSDHLPGQLSGGQRQRVAIARALALRPAIVLADEPTSGLDTRTARRALSLLRGIGQAQGTAFLIASHDQTVQDYVDRSFDLHDGKLIARQMELI
ncbi:MAG: ABC transporter ATP-binding protein [Phototrophicaceae bacterium]